MSDCFFCENGNFNDCNNNHHIDRRKSLNGSWNILKCDNCGIEAIHPKPSLEELSSYYQIYYTSKEFNIKTGYGNKYDRIRKIYHFFNGDVDPRDFINKDQNKVMLDFGYGGATFLNYFHNKGCNIYGAEASESAVEAGLKAKLKVKKIENFEEIPFEDKNFDIIYLMQVFEHLSDPRTFLYELNRVLKVNGELYLGLPNAKSICKKIFKKNWVNWFPPFHIAHYDADNLKKLSGDFGFEYQTHWSKTPESWLRFSLKALIYRNNNQLEKTSTFLDSKIVRLFTIMLTMCFNLLAKENDCLMIKFKKVEDV
jgi:2-polyprenyl-3-methyl-5-hydroxy-6-metoxy-1,4-benzoquinol methylase